MRSDRASLPVTKLAPDSYRLPNFARPPTDACAVDARRTDGIGVRQDGQPPAMYHGIARSRHCSGPRFQLGWHRQTSAAMSIASVTSGPAAHADGHDRPSAGSARSGSCTARLSGTARLLPNTSRFVPPARWVDGEKQARTAGSDHLISEQPGRRDPPFDTSNPTPVAIPAYPGGQTIRRIMAAGEVSNHGKIGLVSGQCRRLDDRRALPVFGKRYFPL